MSCAVPFPLCSAYATACSVVIACPSAHATSHLLVEPGVRGGDVGTEKVARLILALVFVSVIRQRSVEPARAG